MGNDPRCPENGVTGGDNRSNRSDAEFNVFNVTEGAEVRYINDRTVA
jgi:hypothetical protein